MDLDDFDAIMAVNLMGAAYVTHAAFPHMIKQDYGRILMITSASGLYGVFGAANYSAAKMGLVGLMNSLRLESQRHHVYINSVAPIAASRMIEELVEKETLQKISPEQVTPLVLFLAVPCFRSVRGNRRNHRAGAGYFARVAVMEGQGIRFDDGLNITPERIRERYSEVQTMTHARPFYDCVALIKNVVTSEG